MAAGSKYLHRALYDQLKYEGRAKTRDLEKIKAELCKDLLILNNLIDQGVEIAITEETEDRDRYYSVTKDGREIADKNMREYAIDAALESV
jgi:hypothetical protein